MKKILRLIILFCFILFTFFSNSVLAFSEEEKIYLGGISAGFSINEKGAEIIGLCDVITDKGIISPAKDSKLLTGDVIVSIGDVYTDSAKDIAVAIKDGIKQTIIIERGKEKLVKDITPVKDINGEYKIGVFIRDNINGIGTITYIKGNKFAALGHPVLRSDGSLMRINGGDLYKCSVSGCIKGVRGKAGELKGVFVGKKNCGIIERNELTGVYGSLNSGFNFENLKEIEVGEGKPGDAVIYSTVSGEEVKEYKISIIKIDNDNNMNKNFVVKITDEGLIGITGGIVQGMSGSPIVQDGKLVGAITHVFINDPTRGFAVSINKMLNN